LDGIALGAYVGILILAGALARSARAVGLPGGPVVLAYGLLFGRTGLEIVSPRDLAPLLPALTIHVALVLGFLGHRLGCGMLRLPVGEVLRRSVPPLALTVCSLLAGTALLPVLLAGAEPDRSFGRFLLPLAFVFAAFPLLSLRDLRGRAPRDAGSLYLVAVVLFGAVRSFTPPLLWMRPFDPGLFWRGPVLILGESGALGVAVAVLHVFLTRRVRLPRVPVGLVLFVALAAASFRFDLWFPFAALGSGIVLGRTGEPEWRRPSPGPLFAEAPLLLIGGCVFAPDLFRDTVAGPAALHAVWLTVLLLAIRSRFPGGRHLVTGPGFLFLGLALTVRLDPRMGPLTRYTIDFALPAWVLARAVLRGVRWWETRASSRGRSAAG
jgi:hypothetical protein